MVCESSATHAYLVCESTDKGIVIQYNLKTKINFCHKLVISLLEKLSKIQSTQEKECKGLFGSYQLKPMSKECFPFHY